MRRGRGLDGLALAALAALVGVMWSDMAHARGLSFTSADLFLYFRRRRAGSGGDPERW